MLVKQFLEKYNGKKADFDGAYGGQCVDLFRFFNKEVLDIPQPRSVVGAGDFWGNYDTDPNLRENFIKIVNTADFVPIEGDVVVWNKRAGGGYGHIAIVVGSDHTKDYFHSFDQNWSKVSLSEVVKHDYKNVYGVFRPIILSQPEPESDKKYTEAEMTRVREERDANWNLYQGSLEEAKSRKAENEKNLSEIAKSLSLPAGSDVPDILGAIGRLLETEEQLRQAKQALINEEKTHELETMDLKAEIAQLKKDIEKQNQENAKLTSRLESLEVKIENNKVKNEFTTRFKKLFERLFS